MLPLAHSWTLDLDTGRYLRGQGPLPGTMRTNVLFRPDGAVVVDSSGSVLKNILIPPGTRLSFSSTGMVHAVYKDYGHSVEFHSGLGDVQPLRVPSESYPVLSGDGRSVLFVTGEAEGLSLLSLADGRKAGPFTPGYLITDIATCRDRFVVGFINGTLLLIGPEVFATNRNGKERGGTGMVRQEACLMPIVKRVAFSADGRLVACRQGTRPERISVYSVPNLRPVKQIRTDGAQKTRSALLFSPSRRFLLSETPKGFRVYSLLTGRTVFVYEPEGWSGKRFFSAGWMGDGRVAVSVRLPDRAVVTVFDMRGRQVWLTDTDDVWFRIADSGPGRLLCQGPDRAVLWCVPEKGRP